MKQKTRSLSTRIGAWLCARGWHKGKWAWSSNRELKRNGNNYQWRKCSRCLEWESRQ